MILLIDYDNIDRDERRQGVRYVVDDLLDALGPSLAAEVDEGRADHRDGRPGVRCRLYGGWFEGPEPSGRAGGLVRELDQIPRRLDVAAGNDLVAVSVMVELARSLADDDVDLTHTYRRRPFPENLKCGTTPPAECFVQQSCPIGGVQRFVNRGRCPMPGCEVAPEDVLERGEQKLVDSMIVVDLMRFAYKTRETLVVVSGDEDLWPGIRGALKFGAHVVQAIPRERTADAERYRELETETFSRVAL